MRQWMLAAALICAPMVASGQVVVGTNQGAPTAWQGLAETANGYTQTVRARGNLSALSVWFKFGSQPDLGPDFGGWFAFVQVDRGLTFESGFLSVVYIPPTTNGRFDAVFAQPLVFADGEQFSFTVWVNNCSERVDNCAVPVSSTSSLPSLEMTVPDTYFDGEVLNNPSYADPIGADIRFEATFVPEPATMLLLLPSFAVLVMRRRRGSPR